MQCGAHAVKAEFAAGGGGCCYSWMGNVGIVGTGRYGIDTEMACGEGDSYIRVWTAVDFWEE